MHTYTLSSAGRRAALVLLVSALIIWAFALWAFRSTIGTTDVPGVGFFEAARANIAAGLSIAQLIPALLMLVLIVATPLVVWNVLEEWAAVYTVSDQGLRFESLGVDVLYPWLGIVGLERKDEDSDEPVAELLLHSDYTEQIRNPLLRVLHRQAYGSKRLPLYAGIERRDALLADIVARANFADATAQTSAATVEHAATAHTR